MLKFREIKSFLVNLIKPHKVGVILVNKGKIRAVHDQDLENFLQSIGILNKIKSGRLHCSFCGTVITMDNFQCVYPQNKTIKACCSAVGCYKSILTRGKIING